LLAADTAPAPAVTPFEPHCPAARRHSSLLSSCRPFPRDMLLADIEIVNSLRRAFSGPLPAAAECKALVATAAALDARSDGLEGARNKRLLR